MQVVYARQPFPQSWAASIFLAGPTPRVNNPAPSWRPEALHLLRAAGFDGVVFVPEDGPKPKGGWTFPLQVEWERKALQLADVIVCWVPRELTTMPAFTTNVEFGRWVTSGKMILGHPEAAPKTRYLDWLQEDETGLQAHTSLEGTLKAALVRLGEGDFRQEGERYVPLHIWKTAMFQSWYASLRGNGNRLDSAEVLWAFALKGVVFAWVLQVQVWVESEQRHKSNEWVFSRQDIACMVLYTPPSRHVSTLEDLLETQVILVREFRSPVRSEQGFVYEFPGGSSEGGDARAAASRECMEEVGFVPEDDRVQPVQSRQIAATLSSHHGVVFRAQLTKMEMSELRLRALEGEARGVGGGSERTYLEVVTVRDLLFGEKGDWATLGMVTQAVLGS